MGMLMTAAYILAMDCFGPITDNAGGIVEMSNQPEEVRDNTDALDAVGNTTKALTKGYAVGTAGSGRVPSLLGVPRRSRRFSATTSNSVVDQPGGAEGLRRRSDRRRADIPVFLVCDPRRRPGGTGHDRRGSPPVPGRPGIMEGTSEPDYGRCVDISVQSALREMILPGALAVSVPIAVGIILRWEAAAGMLMVGTIAGLLLAVMLNNGGGAWDNAKKLIESGGLTDDDGNVLGKGSPAHAASVVGDTVGDPWKDTAGPSLHVLIKLLATITLVLAPLFI